MFRQIVVGIDEHASGGDAIALAKRLLASDGEMALVHVYLEASGVDLSASASYKASNSLASASCCLV